MHLSTIDRDVQCSNLMEAALNLQTIERCFHRATVVRLRFGVRSILAPTLLEHAPMVLHPRSSRTRRVFLVTGMGTSGASSAGGGPKCLSLELIRCGLLAGHGFPRDTA